MSGYPGRPIRTAFGPTKENEEPVQNPLTDLDASEVNLDFWQIAGTGRVVERVTIGVSAASGSILAHFYQGLAWDPNGTLPDITVTRSGAGVYQATFATTYVNQLGTAVATALLGGIASPQGTANLNGLVSLADAQTADIRIFTADSGVAIDADFLLRLW